MKAVILAGGKGTRLAPYTKILPKPLMPVGDMPILEIILRQMRRAGVEEVCLAVGHLAELLRAFFQDGSRLGLRLSYCYECQPLGTAGPLANVPGLDDTFLVANGDVLTTLSLPDLVDFHRTQQAVATIAAHHRRVKIDLGVLRCNGGQRVNGYVEKPSYDYLASMGIYVFEPRVLNYIPRDAYLDFPTLIQTLIAANEPVVSYPFQGYWEDLGRPDDYERAVRDFEALRHELLLEE